MESFFSNLFFTILVLVTVVPALLVVLTLNIVRAACWLLLSLSGAAGLFFFLGADFVGATQLLIYVGGTLVLVIFGVMLTATGPFVRLSSKSGDWVLSILAAAALFALVAYGIVTGPWHDRHLFPQEKSNDKLVATTNQIGVSLLMGGEKPAAAKPLGAPAPTEPFVSGYLLPFEIVSVHLVVVLIGAAYLARAKRRKTEAA